MCVRVQLLYSPVPIFFRSPLLAALECPKLVSPLSDAPFLIVVSVGIGHVFNLGCCGAPLPIGSGHWGAGEPSLETVLDRVSEAHLKQCTMVLRCPSDCINSVSGTHLKSQAVLAPLLLNHHLDQLRYFVSRQITRVGNIGLDIRGKNKRDTLLGSAVTDASHNDVAECS
jgi:hypothetical protein